MKNGPVQGTGPSVNPSEVWLCAIAGTAEVAAVRPGGRLKDGMRVFRTCVQAPSGDGQKQSLQLIVMPGLVPGIHVVPQSKHLSSGEAWMPGSSPGMTE